MKTKDVTFIDETGNNYIIAVAWDADTKEPCSFETIQKGQMVRINENARVKLGLPDNLEYYIEDVIEQQVDYQICLKCEELGADWTEFFSLEELILAEKV
jgi:predicted peroxiredoxin